MIVVGLCAGFAWIFAEMVFPDDADECDCFDCFLSTYPNPR